MTPDRLVRQQLTLRLRRLRARIATLTAEAEMIERMVADAEKFSTVPKLKLRANSQGKWTVRGQVRGYLTNKPAPVKAQAIFEFLLQYDPSLNSSTFRSHLKRMVDDGIIRQEGNRGHYRLVAEPNREPKEPSRTKPRQITIIRRGS